MGLGGKADPYDESVYVKVPSGTRRCSGPSPCASNCASRSPAIPDPTPRPLIAAIRAGHVYTAFDAHRRARRPWRSRPSPAGPARARARTSRSAGPVRLRAVTNGPPRSASCLLRDGEVIAQRRRPVARVGGPSARRVPRRGAPARARPAILRCRGSSATRLRRPAGARRGPDAGAAGSRPASYGPPARGTSRKTSAHREAPSASAGGDLIRHTLRYDLAAAAPSPFVALVTLRRGPDARRRPGWPSARPPPAHAPVGAGAPGRRRGRAALAAVGLSLPGRRATSPSASPTCAWRAPARASAFAPARIDSLLFVVDTVNARPGDGGTLWVEGLRTER